MNIQKKLMKVRNDLRSGKDARNTFGKYNYRNAETMLSSIKPLLEKQGLTIAFSDEIQAIGDRFYLKTTATIYDTEDGESFSTTSMAREQAEKKGMDEAQITGAAITYCHKYALMGMFAISDPTMDPDSMDNSQPTQTQQQTQPQYQQPQQYYQQAQAYYQQQGWGGQ